MRWLATPPPIAFVVAKQGDIVRSPPPSPLKKDRSNPLPRNKKPTPPTPLPLPTATHNCFSSMTLRGGGVCYTPPSHTGNNDLFSLPPDFLLFWSPPQTGDRFRSCCCFLFPPYFLHLGRCCLLTLLLLLLFRPRSILIDLTFLFPANQVLRAIPKL